MEKKRGASLLPLRLIAFSVMIFVLIILSRLYIRATIVNNLAILPISFIITLIVGSVFSSEVSKNKNDEKISMALKLINNGGYVAPEALDGINEVIVEELYKIDDKLKNGSKFLTQRLELNKEQLEIKSLIKSSLNTFSKEIENSTVDFKMNFSEEDINFNGDKMKLKRVFKKIFHNNLKYSHNNTRIYVDLKEDDEEIKIEIKNIAKDEIHLSPSEIIDKEFLGERDIILSHGGNFNLEIDGDLFKVVIVFYREVKF